MGPTNKKSTLQFSIILLLLTSIGLTIYLIYQQQRLKTEAGNVSILVKNQDGTNTTYQDNLYFISSPKVILELSSDLILTAKEDGTTEVGHKYVIPKGETLLGLVVESSSSYKASSLLADLNRNFTSKTLIEKVYSVSKWDSNNGRYIEYKLEDPTNNFDIKTGQGVLIKSKTEGETVLTGKILTINYLEIPTGRSIISLPKIPQNITSAKSLLQLMQSQGITAISLSKLSEDELQTYILNSSNNDFPIQAGEGYFVQNKGPLGYFYPNPDPYSTILYRLAENPITLEQTPFLPYAKYPERVLYELKDQTPGNKFIWVEFLFGNGSKQRQTIQLKLGN